MVSGIVAMQLEEDPQDIFEFFQEGREHSEEQEKRLGMHKMGS